MRQQFADGEVANAIDLDNGGRPHQIEHDLSAPSTRHFQPWKRCGSGINAGNGQSHGDYAPRNSGKEGDTFGATAQPIAGGFDVATHHDLTVGAEDGGANVKFGVGRVGVGRSVTSVPHEGNVRVVQRSKFKFQGFEGSRIESWSGPPIRSRGVIYRQHKCGKTGRATAARGFGVPKAMLIHASRGEATPDWLVQQPLSAGRGPPAIRRC